MNHDPATPRSPGAADDLRILAFNWRDPQHPEAGGAEVHLHELLRRFVARGAQVTQLASGFAGGARETTIDGVRILRRGRWYDANWVLRRAYQRDLAGEPFDLIIEDINKIPFFTPCFVRAPVLAVVPHLFGTTVFREAAWPLATYVYLHELLLPRIYRHTEFLVISDSTRDDLVARGLVAERIHVVPVGLDHAHYCPDATVSKEAVPLVVYLGRIRRYKGVQDLVRAVARLRQRQPAVQLKVVGDGPYRRTIERLARGVPGVEVLGFVDAATKLDLLRRAWVAVYPSAKEGFGLTVIEANACGTPVVAADVPGLRDAVRVDESGLLVPHGDVEALAAALARIIEDGELRERLTAGGVRWARSFSWDDATDAALQVARRTIARAAGAGRGSSA